MKLKKVCSMVMAAAMVVATVGMVPSSSYALEGIAEYEPAESNISSKYWISNETSVGNGSLALDGDMATVWKTSSSPAVMKVDLSGTYNAVRKIVTVFEDSSRAHRYMIEGSTDGQSWKVLADRSKNSEKGSVFTDVFAMEGIRYIRLTVLSEKTSGVKEFKIINYLRADMDNGSDCSEQGGNTNAYYYNAGNDPVTEYRGGKFTDEGSIENGNNFFGLTKDMGWDTIRLRIWNDPKSEGSGNENTRASNCSPENTRRVAKAIKGAGQNLAIDFHYADSWSDPQNQPKPYAWAELSFDELVDEVYTFTYDMINSLVEQGTAPTIVALGNEISNGMLWGKEYDDITNFVHHHDYYNKGLHQLAEGGGIKWLKYEEAKGDKNSQAYKEFEASIDNLSRLVDAGNRAIKQLNADKGLNIQTEMHFAFNVFEQPVNQDKVQLDPEQVFEKVKTLVGGLATRLDAKGGMVDRIGISYYPDWHGDYATVQRNIVELSKMLPGVKFNIAECSPKAKGTLNDWMSDPNHEVGFEYSIQSQGDDTMNIMKTINDVPNNVGMGVWPWAGTNVYGNGWGDTATLNASFKVWNDAFAKNVLESEVSAATEPGIKAKLPSTVKNLDVATGTVSDVPVVWDESNVTSDLYAAEGCYTVTGKAAVTVPEAGRGKEMTKVTATVLVKEKEPVDFTKLEAQIEAYKALNLDAADYTEDSWNAYSEALQEAEKILKNPEVEQEIVDAALADLRAKYAALTKNPADTEETEDGKNDDKTNSSNKTENKNNTKKPVKTGDYNLVFSYLAFAAFAMIAACLKKHKKNF